MELRVVTADAQLHPDPSRLALQLFLPGEDTHEEYSRVSIIAQRILDLPEQEVEREAARVLASFTGEDDHLSGTLRDHAASVAIARDPTAPISAARTLVMGAAFTSEFAVEAAALCNPSAVPHPNQSGLKPGELRVAVALRGIGEGHISSIEFVSAVIGPGRTWTFGERNMPLVRASTESPRWSREHFLVTLEAEMRGRGVEIAHAVAQLLPAQFTLSDFELAVRSLPAVLLRRQEAVRHLDHLRTLVEAAYRAEFPVTSHLSQRVLMPVTPDEVNGMEDARFVLCTYPDGSQVYRATYTAYDGTHIAPRLIISPDLRHFDVHRLSGPAAKNKGMALFPRHVNGQLLALTRTDGETLGISHSEHGRVWATPQPLHRPTQLWQIIQTGNCGSPLETEHGWLVLTHGVGLMRSYSIGAILLDLDHPERVIAALDAPLIVPEERPGYVPNVVYSCGGIIHDGMLWIPYGVGDRRIGVASVGVDELVAAMTPAA
jgi:predicted GH43/DUF377 family glycosyl hydrolase